MSCRFASVSGRPTSTGSSIPPDDVVPLARVDPVAADAADELVGLVVAGEVVVAVAAVELGDAVEVPHLHVVVAAEGIDDRPPRDREVVLVGVHADAGDVRVDRASEADVIDRVAAADEEIAHFAHR